MNLLFAVCPKCKSDVARLQYGGERGEAGPFIVCNHCDYNEEEEQKIMKKPRGRAVWLSDTASEQAAQLGLEQDRSIANIVERAIKVYASIPDEQVKSILRGYGEFNGG